VGKYVIWIVGAAILGLVIMDAVNAAPAPELEPGQPGADDLPTNAPTGDNVIENVANTTLNPIGSIIGYIMGNVITPRGERNNNPGNIKRNNIAWEGMSADQSGDAVFVVFDDPIYGIRALGKLLQKYAENGYVTVRQIITRYAPGSENNTGAYIKAVSAALGVSPDAPLNLFDMGTLRPLASAIITHENGRNVYLENGVLDAGLALV